GLKRAGIPPGEGVAAFAAALRDLPGLDLKGVMAWEAHTTAIKDAAAKQAAVERADAALVESARRMEARGVPAPSVSCGGTGTYWLSAKCPGVAEFQAGGGIFSALRHRREFAVPNDCALTVWTTVSSRRSPKRIIVDAGWKTMA